MAPLISFITVVRNDKRGLELTLSSIVGQDTDPHEIIIVDGLSRDGSLEFAKSCGTPGVKTIEGPDTGIYDAMNKGLRAASGDYIWFLNAGDILASNNSLATVADFLETSACEWIYGAALPVDDQNIPSGPVLQARFTRRDLRRGTIHVNHQAMVMSKKLLKELGGFRLKFRLAAEYDLYLRASSVTEPAPLPQILVHYRVGGTSFQHRAQHLLEMGEARREEFQLTGFAAIRNCLATRFLAWRTTNFLSRVSILREARNAYLTRRYSGPSGD